AFSNDGRLVFIGEGERVTVVDAASGRLVARIPQLGPERSFFSGMAAFPDGKRFAAGDAYGHLLIGRVAGSASAFIAKSPDPVIRAQRVAVSPDGRRAYVGIYGEIAVYDLATVPS